MNMAEYGSQQSWQPANVNFEPNCVCSVSLTSAANN